MHKGTPFINETIWTLLEDFMIVHHKPTAYCSQANGWAEAPTKILIGIFTKIVSKSCLDWEHQLQAALWAYRTTYKVSMGQTPFTLVYALDVLMSTYLLVPSIHMVVKMGIHDGKWIDRLLKLEKLSET